MFQHWHVGMRSFQVKQDHVNLTFTMSVAPHGHPYSKSLTYDLIEYITCAVCLLMSLSVHEKEPIYFVCGLEKMSNVPKRVIVLDGVCHVWQ